MYKHLETDRLLIRPINLNDADFIIQLTNSVGWLKFIGNRNIKEKSESEIYIQKILDNNKFFYSVFELKETKEPIGIITFLNRDGYDYPDIGFATLPQFQKNHYTFEVVRKNLDELIMQKNTAKICGITITENINSIRFLEKLGFSFKKTILKDNEELFLYELEII